MNIIGKAFVALLAAIPFALLSQGAILSPDQRTERLGVAQSFLDVSVVTVEKDLLEEVGNPFTGKRLAVKKVIPVKNSATLTDEELLTELSKFIDLTGIFAINGQYIAIMGEQHITSGSNSSIKYGENEYLVQFDEITRNSFVIRYREAELKIKLK